MGSLVRFVGSGFNMLTTGGSGVGCGEREREREKGEKGVFRWLYGEEMLRLRSDVRMLTLARLLDEVVLLLGCSWGLW